MHEDRAIYLSADLSWSFARLDRELGFGTSRGDTALEDWYHRIAERPIGQLVLDDLCRSVRQRLHLPLTVRRALEELRHDLWAGSSYPGELLAAFVTVPRELFEDWRDLGDELILLGRQALLEGHPRVHDDMDGSLWSEIAGDLRAWLQRATGAPPSEPVLTVEVGVGDGDPVVIPIATELEITVGSAPTATIYRPQPESKLARSHAVLRMMDARRLEVQLLGHHGELNGAPLQRSCPYPVALGDTLELGAVTLHFHLSSSEVSKPPTHDDRAGELPPTSADFQAGLNYLVEAAPPPPLQGPATEAFHALWTALNTISFEASNTEDERTNIADLATSLRALLTREERRTGSYGATLLELAEMVAQGVVPLQQRSPPEVVSNRLARLKLSHLAGRPERIKAELDERLARLTPDIDRWNSEQSLRFAKAFEEWEEEE